MPLNDVQTAGLLSAIWVLVFTFALSSIPKTSLNSRVASMVLLAALSYSFNEVSGRTYDNMVLRTAFPGAICTLTFHATDLLLVSRAAIGDFPAVGGGPLGDLLVALRLLCNWRRIGTPWQISKLPKFSPDGAVPSRGRLIAKRALLLVVALAIVDIGTGLRGEPDAFDPRAVPVFSRLGDTTAAEVGFRVSQTAAWMTCAVVGVYIPYAFVTIVLLATGLSNPASCPPVYGSLSDAYTIRGFWGDFYHQLIRKAITGPADAFVDKVLCIPRGTLISRYTRLTLAFLASGLMHLVDDVSIGIPSSEAGQFVFFTSQAFGIMFEDAIKACYKASGRPFPRWLERGIGYVWVAAWLCWTAPGWFYPVARYMGPQDSGFKTMMTQA